jgi:4-amino-4-deoxy-L-arabinose transferase-like glycosyltransferase
MKQASGLSQSLVSDRYWARVFIITFCIYTAIQYFLFYRITLYFPNGFETENFYSPIAAHIAEGGLNGVLAYLLGEMPPGMPYGPTFRPPLYPIVLAALYQITYTSEFLALCLNNVLLSFSVLFTYLTGSLLSSKVGAIASFVFMLDIILISEANSTHSDTLFLVFIISAHYFVARSILTSHSLANVVAAGTLLGLAILTRNIGLYFLPAILVVYVVHGISSKRLVAMLLATIVFSMIIGLAVGSWKVRNYYVTKDAAFSSGNMAVHLNHYYLPLVYANRDGIAFDLARQKVKSEFESLPGFTGMTLSQRDSAKIGFAITKTVVNAHWVALTLVDNLPKLLLSYPFEVLATLANQAQMKNWQRFDSAEFKKRYERSNFDIPAKFAVFKYYWNNGMAVSAIYGLTNKVANGISFILALAGVFLLWRHENKSLRIIGTLLLLQCFIILSISILAPSARFRIPIMPFISLAAAIAVNSLMAATKSRGPANNPNG